MAWVTLTEDDVRASLNESEVDNYQKVTAESQAAPLTSILADVTSEVRGYVGRRYPLEATGIPRSTKNAAVDITIYRLCKRLQTKTEPQRKQAADDAVEFLKGIAKGDIAVESDGPSLAGSGAEIVTSSDRQVDRETMEGI